MKKFIVTAMLGAFLITGACHKTGSEVTQTTSTSDNGSTVTQTNTTNSQ